MATKQTAALAFLARCQEKSGAFAGHASPATDNFSSFQPHPTPFFTALILASLATVPGSEAIRNRAAAFLLGERSPQWTWNYWQRASDKARSQPYPDDLDDTCCALAALALHDPTLIDGGVLGHVAGTLVANEVAPGGPYGTWLVDLSLLPKWRDVDLAVNANIAFFLQTQQVHAPGLEAYLTQAIRTDRLTSAYYVGRPPLLYLLARSYDGPAAAQLRKLIWQAITGQQPAAPALFQALLLSAGCQVRLTEVQLKPLRERLLKSRTGDHWPAAALYYDPPVEGQVRYAGSEALTTAFALEALQRYEQLFAAAPGRRRTVCAYRRTTIQAALRECRTLPYPDLRRHLRRAIRETALNDRGQQISGIAEQAAGTMGYALPKQVALELNLGSLFGWTAYTLYDDILDGERSPLQLGTANVAARAAVGHFTGALPDQAAWRPFVGGTLAIVDGANTWEAVQARATVTEERLTCRRLPDYGDYAQLAERSWGHVLAPTGVLLAAGHALGTEPHQNFQDFFRHYLIARQLNDDAHDWESDLKAGRLSAAVVALLRSTGRRSAQVDLEKQLADLRLQFWERTILELSQTIHHHLEAAQQALDRCTFIKQPALYEGWLQALQGATDRALQERAEAQKFIESYAYKI